MDEQRLELIRALREHMGASLMCARRAVAIGDEHADGDALIGYGFVYASGLAITVRNDRHGWNLRRGKEFAEEWRTKPHLEPLVAAITAYCNRDTQVPGQSYGPR